MSFANTFPHGEPVTPQLVRSVIEQRFKLNQLPLNSELREFNLTEADLLQLQVTLNKAFGKDVTVRHRHTIYTLTDSLNQVTV